MKGPAHVQRSRPGPLSQSAQRRGIADADASVEVTNPVCGDILRLAVRVKEGRIDEVRFLCRGCTTAIACASLLTEQLRGRTATEWKRSLRNRCRKLSGDCRRPHFTARNLLLDALQRSRRNSADDSLQGLPDHSDSAHSLVPWSPRAAHPRCAPTQPRGRLCRAARPAVRRTELAEKITGCPRWPRNRGSTIFAARRILR